LVQEITKDPVSQILWRPDSGGIAYISSESLYNVQVPEGETVLIEDGFGDAVPLPGYNLIWVQR
jgi:hypothetical protein